MASFKLIVLLIQDRTESSITNKIFRIIIFQADPHKREGL